MRRVNELLPAVPQSGGLVATARGTLHALRMGFFVLLSQLFSFLIRYRGARLKILVLTVFFPDAHNFSYPKVAEIFRVAVLGAA